MLPDDELAELAESIKTRGLDHPIVLDNQGRVLDGRNRLAACELAGVEPEFTKYEAQDSDDYALRNGITRRHLKTGARAIIAAKAARLNGQSIREAAAVTDLGRSRIGEANIVLDWAPALADAVIAGKPLSVAVEEARETKAETEKLKAKLNRLRAEAPDLHTLVDEERMTADDAIAALDARKTKQWQDEQDRKRKNAEEQRDARALLTRIVDLAAPQTMNSTFIESWAQHLGRRDNELNDLMDRTEAAAQTLHELKTQTTKGWRK